MAEAYKAYFEAVEGHRARISELNTEINQNRGEYERALGERDKAVLTGDKAAAEQHRATCSRLDEGLKWLQRDLQILSGNGARHNPVVLAAAKQVMAENRKLMEHLQNRWEHVTKSLNEHKAAFMQLVCELGSIQQQALKLRAQLNDITSTTGLTGAWLSAPGDRLVNLDKSTGIIFMDPKEAAERFKFPDKYKADKEQHNGVI